MEKWIKVNNKLEISEHDTPDIKDSKKCLWFENPYQKMEFLFYMLNI